MKTIFVVDDNIVNLMMADDALSDRYNVITFAAVTNMLNVLNKITPDLILMDVLMPGIDGFEALKLLKADARFSNIPVMFLTSDNNKTTESRGFEMGITGFISKPYSQPVLLDRITAHFEENNEKNI